MGRDLEPQVRERERVGDGEGNEMTPGLISSFCDMKIDAQKKASAMALNPFLGGSVCLICLFVV